MNVKIKSYSCSTSVRSHSKCIRLCSTSVIDWSNKILTLSLFWTIFILLIYWNGKKIHNSSSSSATISHCEIFFEYLDLCVFPRTCWSFPAEMLQSPCFRECITHANNWILPAVWPRSWPFLIIITTITPTSAHRHISGTTTDWSKMKVITSVFLHGGVPGSDGEGWRKSDTRTILCSDCNYPRQPPLPPKLQLFPRKLGWSGTCHPSLPLPHSSTHPPTQKLEATITKSKTMTDAFRWKYFSHEKRKDRLETARVNSCLFSWWLLGSVPSN